MPKPPMLPWETKARASLPHPRPRSSYVVTPPPCREPVFRKGWQRVTLVEVTNQSARRSDIQEAVMAKDKVQSLDHAVRTLAARKLASSKPEQILAQLRRHGIGSLEDLAAKVVENASRSVQSGSSASFEDDIPMICYKFTSFRPVVSVQELEQQVTELGALIQGGGAVGGPVGGGAAAGGAARGRTA